MIFIIEKEKMHIMESGGGESKVDRPGRGDQWWGHGISHDDACGGHHRGKVKVVVGREVGRRHTSDIVLFFIPTTKVSRAP
jgi:hypothetical protein